MDKPIALCDIDGTLASNHWRRPLVEGAGRKDWRSFFLLAQFDAPVEQVVLALARLRSGGFTVVMVTGRPDTYRRLTCAWLDLCSIQYEDLLMRPDRDHRSDAECKRDLVRSLDLGSVKAVFDDRPETISLWQDLGLEVTICVDPQLEPRLPDT